MASSSNDPDSLVTLRFHDFRVERMRHWWTLLGEDDHADIVGIFGKFPPFMRLQVDRGLLEALASFWDPTHCCFSIGEVDLIPTMEEYAELLQLDSPFSETPVIPIQGPRSNRCLEKYLGLTTAVLRPEIARPEETWRKANISLDLLTKYFSRSAFPAKLARDFIVGKKGWKKFRINAFKIAFAGDRERGFRCSAHSSSSSGSAVTCSISTASRLLIILRGHTVSQTVQIALPFTGDSRAWALYLLDLPLSGWVLEGHYPSLALRQFSGVQYPPRLGDLDAVTFDYIPGEDMWRLLFRIEDIWGGRLSEMVLIEEGSPGDSSVTSDFVEWREGWTPFFTLRPTVRPGAPYSLISRSLRVSASTGQPERVTVLERELEEAQTELLSLRLARASEREASAARVESSAEEQLEISEDAKEQLEETLAEAREQLETEQAERTRVQDELDSLRSYTQALVDPATGRPQDIVALRRALDASEEALTPSWILVHDALESNASWLNQEGFPVVTSLHQINQVMDSLGTRARAVWEEHDEGDPALSTALGRFCREACIRLAIYYPQLTPSPAFHVTFAYGASSERFFTIPAPGMIAPPEKAFFTTYGPSYDGANFPRGSVEFVLFYAAFRGGILQREGSLAPSTMVVLLREGKCYPWLYTRVSQVGGGGGRVLGGNAATDCQNQSWTGLHKAVCSSLRFARKGSREYFRPGGEKCWLSAIEQSCLVLDVDLELIQAYWSSAYSSMVGMRSTSPMEKQQWVLNEHASEPLEIAPRHYGPVYATCLPHVLSHPALIIFRARKGPLHGLPSIRVHFSQEESGSLLAWTHRRAVWRHEFASLDIVIPRLVVYLCFDAFMHSSMHITVCASPVGSINDVSISQSPNLEPVRWSHIIPSTSLIRLASVASASAK
uniref:DUF7745 domain-containing protein n=1 Tax=Fagus sylvatica TaxID=28930 RepID=A0A2N9FHS8_FAGSY